MAELFDILAHKHVAVTNQDIPTTHPAWHRLLTLDALALAAGVYEVAVSIGFDLDSVSQSFIWRISNDGGATWTNEYYIEPSDRTNIGVVNHLAYIDIAGGDVQILVDVTREGSAVTTVVEAVAAIIRRS